MIVLDADHPDRDRQEAEAIRTQRRTGETVKIVYNEPSFTLLIPGDAWNQLVDRPWKIMSIGLRDWAHGF